MKWSDDVIRSNRINLTDRQGKAAAAAAASPPPSETCFPFPFSVKMRFNKEILSFPLLTLAQMESSFKNLYTYLLIDSSTLCCCCQNQKVSPIVKKIIKRPQSRAMERERKSEHQHFSVYVWLVSSSRFDCLIVINCAQTGRRWKEKEESE